MPSRGLTPGTTIGIYKIVGPIGAGGMGEVYRATDTTLGRDVAIKILPESFAGGPSLSVDLASPQGRPKDGRLSRFEREAKTLASLNHPNIAQVFGLLVEERAIVMELLEGETLRERLKAGPLAVRKAVEVATQMARGLSAAHERGIIHRDLKPENVFVLRDGHVKILDFGLARQAATPASGGSETMTAAAPGTDPGTVMGTVGYMAPEQVRAETLDARADLFALGAVLFEVLTGQRAFWRDTAAETLTAILRDDPPDLLTSRTDLSPALERIVRHCLEKNPLERFQTARDVAFALSALSGPGSASSDPTSARARSTAGSRERWMWAGVATILAATTAWLAIPSFTGNADSAVPYRASILLPEGVTLTKTAQAGARLAISPDGTRVAFSGVSGSVSQKQMLWVQSLIEPEAHAIEGTEGAFGPFWSPDGRQIAFSDGDEIRRVDAVTGGRTRFIDGSGAGAWGGDDAVLFVRRRDGHLFHAASFGATVDLTPQSAANERFSYPFFIPGGRDFLFGRRNSRTPAVNGTYVRSLDSADSTRVVPDLTTNASYANGHLVFARGGTLFAQPFDPGRRALSGEPVAIAEGVDDQGQSGAAYSVSNAGALVFARALGASRSRLVWMDREGRTLSSVSDEADYSNLELSPDGRRLAVSVLDPARRSRDIFLVDLERGVRQRLTFDASDERSAIWSLDGRRVIFSSRRSLYSRASDFTGDDEAVRTDVGGADPMGISPDGRVLYRRAGTETGDDLWVTPLDGEQEPVAVFESPFDESFGAFSPDGRSMVFVSDESGEAEVYVTSLEGGGGKAQISTGGGTFPRWRRDGREIVYLGADQMLMSIIVSGSGARFQPSATRALFRVDAQPGPGAPFALSADGQRLIVNVAIPSGIPPSLTLVVNWPSLVRKDR